MLDLTAAEETKLKALLALTHEDIENNLHEQAKAIVGEAMTEANVQRFGERVSAVLLPELETLFGAVEAHTLTLEARLAQAETRIKVLERLCARLMPVGVRS